MAKQTVELAASAARTATGTGEMFCGFSGKEKFAFLVDCTAASGTTPTLDVDIQHSIDGGTNWFDLVSFTQLTAAGDEMKVEAEVDAATAEIVGDCLRAIWTIAGTTPSFTFKVVVEASDS